MPSASPDTEPDPAAALPASESVHAMREPDGRSAHAAEHEACAGDVRLCEADRLLRHVAERLRRSGVDLPDARLQHLSEELVVDVSRVVLAWAEEPLPGASRRASGHPHRRRREP